MGRFATFDNGALPIADASADSAGSQGSHRDTPRPHRYWPPPDGVGNGPVSLPLGRKLVSVQAMKSDEDGALEAQVVFTTRGGQKLIGLNEEELIELEKLAPRITEYLHLWQEKAREEQLQDERQRLQPELERLRSNSLAE